MLASAFLLAALAASPAADTAPIDCDSCAQWNEPQKPFRLHGDSYYVGVRGLSSVLIATPRGLILIDGGLPQSAPQIAGNIRSLGYRVEDLKWIVVSHAHYDHAGGVAALARLSGAKVGASRSAASVLRAGMVQGDDPQAGFGDAMRLPPVAHVHEMADGASISLGGVSLTAHATPGHTPGGTSWSWRSCEQGRCLDMVYADSLTPVSAPGFRFTGNGNARVDEFRASIGKVRHLRCGILVSAHPDFSGLFDRLSRRDADPARNALIDPAACKAYADDADKRLDLRIAQEQSGR